MSPAPLHLLAVPYPGDAGWGDVLFVILWALGSLLLASYYLYKAFFTPR
ncbi:MAG: hypothetical protein WCB85_02080 [Candidatus Dormiibacterota bacterium]|jgi:hypothetical protein